MPIPIGLGGRDVAAEITRGWYDSTRETAQRVRDKADETARTTFTPSAPQREARVSSAAAVRASDTQVE